MGPDMQTLLLLTIALGGLTQVRGVYQERFYTGACDREGVPAWEDRPTSGQRLFVRLAGDGPAPPLAEATSGEGGAFQMSFQPPAPGEYCVARKGADRIVCLSTFLASPIEGSAWMRVILGPVNPRPHCVSQRRAMRGLTLFVEEPCGDGGRPPRPLGHARVRIHGLDGPGADREVDSDADGHFEASLLPGRYCALAGLPGPSGRAIAGGCLAAFEIADRDVDGVTVPFERRCGSADARRPGQEPLPPRARGVGRVAALGGTIHVRGLVSFQTSYWGGAYRREPPPAFTAGNVLRVRRGDRNGSRALVAEVTTDEYGFDVALPPGVWCLETTYHDEWFKGWATANRAEFDRACLQRAYQRCDLVARLADRDVEGVRIDVVQWHPPSFPCRRRPYSGPSPP